VDIFFFYKSLLLSTSFSIFITAHQGYKVLLWPQSNGRRLEEKLLAVGLKSIIGTVSLWEALGPVPARLKRTGRPLLKSLVLEGRPI
jgi:hypothetical protein